MSSSELADAGISSLNRCHALLKQLHIVMDVAEKNALLEQLAAPSRPLVLSFLNQHGFNLTWQDDSFAQALAISDKVLRDGIGMSVCLRLLHHPAGLNLNGTDLIPEIARRFSGRRIVLCGTTEPYLTQASQALQAQACPVQATTDGFADDQYYVDWLKEQRPELLILGMGMPKQERVAALLAATLDFPILIVNGGAILDFLAGRFQRAPVWVRQLRMEWLYRLIREPKRLASRYLSGGVIFVIRVLRLRFYKPAARPSDKPPVRPFA